MLLEDCCISRQARYTCLKLVQGVIHLELGLFHALYYEEHVYTLKYKSNPAPLDKICCSDPLTVLAHVRVSGHETKIVRVRFVYVVKYLTCCFPNVYEPPSCIALCREKVQYATNHILSISEKSLITP